MTQKPTVRILHVLGRMNRGGAELRTLDLMRHIDRTVYKFEFCCLSGLPGELDEDIRRLDGVVHLIRLGITFPFTFRKLLRTRGYHVVHSNVHWSSGFILRLAAAERVPERICHFASTWDGKHESMVRRQRNQLLRRWIDAYATEILGVSEGALSANWGPAWREDKRCRVIYRGIDMLRVEQEESRDSIRRDLCIPEDAMLVVHVGRMDAPKNHIRLLAIFRELLKRVPNAYLILVGATRDPVYTQVKQLVQRAGIAERVIIAGIRSDVPRILRASDQMIFPSLWEGLPGSVLEALSTGLPVLATNLPGINEIAQHLPGIRPMSLERSDEEWANAAYECQHKLNPLVAMQQAIKTSPFSMCRVVAAYEDLYARI